MASNTANVKSSPKAARCLRKFMRYFPKGFEDQDYFGLERGYKQLAHKRWQDTLEKSQYKRLLNQQRFGEIATRALGIESRTNLLFSFEKMALRDGLKKPEDQQAFATGLYRLLYGAGGIEQRFDDWCTVLGGLTRRKTRVLTWPVATVYGFIAEPKQHFYLKPTVTKAAAQAYGYDLPYASRPTGAGYLEVLKFAALVRRDLQPLRPQDMIDIQSFLWVLGSSEYP